MKTTIILNESITDYYLYTVREKISLKEKGMTSHAFARLVRIKNSCGRISEIVIESGSMYPSIHDNLVENMLSAFPGSRLSLGSRIHIRLLQLVTVLTEAYSKAVHYVVDRYIDLRFKKYTYILDDGRSSDDRVYPAEGPLWYLDISHIGKLFGQEVAKCDLHLVKFADVSSGCVVMFYAEKLILCKFQYNTLGNFVSGKFRGRGFRKWSDLSELIPDKKAES